MSDGTAGRAATTSVGALEGIARLRVVPVIVLDDEAAAAPLAAALVDGGLPVAEVTFRAASAERVLAAMAADGRLLVGAGTVLTGDQVDRAVAAGARFVVSPGFSEPVVRRARERGLPALPGVATATEIMAALDAGLTTVKFFPAQACGGPPALRALAAPFPQVRFVPTGGISAADLPGYLGIPAVTAVGGSWMVAPSLVAAGRYDEVTRLAAEAVAVAAGGSAAGPGGPSGGPVAGASRGGRR